MGAVAALWGWKLAFYAGLLALALWRMSSWKARAQKAFEQVLEREGELARLRAQVAQYAEEARDIHARLLTAQQESAAAQDALQRHLAQATPPPADPAGAIDWLKQAAKEDR